MDKEFTNYLISGNHKKCSEIANNYFKENDYTFLLLYENLLKSSLYKIGELWENNIISVATEHMASAIVENILNEFYDKIVSRKKIEKRVIVACTEKEYHQIGIKMVSDFFELNGWNSYFYGAGFSTDDLISKIRIIHPDIIALSLSIQVHLLNLEKMIDKIRQEFPDLPILIGGQAFRFGGQDLFYRYKNVIFKSNLDDIELFIKELI